MRVKHLLDEHQVIKYNIFRLWVHWNIEDMKVRSLQMPEVGRGEGESCVLLKGREGTKSRPSCHGCSRIWRDISPHQHIHSLVPKEIIHEFLAHKDILKLWQNLQSAG